MTPDDESSESLNQNQNNEFNFDRIVNLKVFLSILSVLLSISSFVAASGVIWFEKFGSDSKRIFTNKVTNHLWQLTELKNLLVNS